MSPDSLVTFITDEYYIHISRLHFTVFSAALSFYSWNSIADIITGNLCETQSTLHLAYLDWIWVTYIINETAIRVI